MICPRSDCPVSRRARAINDTILASQAKHGFTFKAEMEFGEWCNSCQKTILYDRLADGELRLRSKREAA